MQVSSTVNPKVFDIAAMGAVPLSDYRPELDELFPDASVRPKSFQSLEELPDRVSDLLHQDLDGYRYRLAAYTRQHHSLVNRARWIMENLVS